jgi:hypothetical protein
MKATSVDNIHNAGRLCDKEVEGCEADRFQPLNINGWFWASTLRMMPPTNLRSDRVVSGNRNFLNRFTQPQFRKGAGGGGADPL